MSLANIHLPFIPSRVLCYAISTDVTIKQVYGKLISTLVLERITGQVNFWLQPLQSCKCTFVWNFMIFVWLFSPATSFNKNSIENVIGKIKVQFNFSKCTKLILCIMVVGWRKLWNTLDLHLTLENFYKK